MADVAIQVRGLVKRYDGVQAVAGVDLDVRRGEVVGLVGPNGAGKTSVLKMMAGLVEPSGGTVRVLGGDPLDPATRARIGFLPETSPVYEDLAPSAYLELFAGLYGLDAAEGRRRAADILHRLDLPPLARPLGTFSKGMRRKVALARCLLHDPDVLVLDEAASGLDPVVAHTVLQALREQAAAGRAVVFSAHNLSHVEAVSDRIVLMHRGRIVMDGTMDDLRAKLPPRGYRVSFDQPIDGARPWQSAFVAEVATFDEARELMATAAAKGVRVLDVWTREPPLRDLFMAVVPEGDERGD